MLHAQQRLVGRTEELAAVDRVLAATRSGASVLELSGEPGIGKTRLLAELARAASEEGRLVLAGRASELERDLPYWIFVDAIDDYLRTVDVGWLERLQEGAGEELGRIFPALAGRGSQTATLLDERYRAHHAVRALLEQLADEHPLVLVLDDIHWADPASIDLLAALLRRPPQASVLLALALRPRQAPARLANGLEQAHRTRLSERIRVGALSEEEAAEMLGSEVPRSIAKRLYAESGGNPFFLEELARAVRSASRERLAFAGADEDALVADVVEVPPAVATALTHELRELPGETRRLLEAAAVVGDPFEVELAAEVAPVAEPAALTSLDQLLASDLVRRTDLPRRFRFRHPLVRRAVYEAAPGGWRRGAHERAAHALAARGEHPALRAVHVEHFAQRGDRGAVALLRQAAEASADRAPASAARWYRAALDLLPPDHDEAERAELLGRLAHVLAGAGEYRQSRETLLELLELVRRDDGSRVRMVARLAYVEHLLGQHEQAHARLRSTLDQLPDPYSADAADVLRVLAMDSFYGRDFQEMRRQGERALAIARSLDDAALGAAAHAITALACSYTGPADDAERHRDEAARLLDALPDETLAIRLDTAANLGIAEMNLDRYEDALRHLDRGLDVGRSGGQGQLFPLLSLGKGFTLMLLGRLADAAAVFDGTIEAARLSRNPRTLSWALYNRAFAALLAGDLELALETADESADLEQALDESTVGVWSASIRGWVMLEAGEPKRCLDVILPAAGGPDLPRLDGGPRVHIQEKVTRAFLALGQIDEADGAASRAETHAAELGIRFALVAAKRARAAVALAVGEAREASAAALDSAAIGDAIHAPVEASCSRTVAGKALIAAGERERAAAELEQAAAAFHECGSLRYRDEAERELRRIGRRHRRRRTGERADGEGLAALTERELEVAELVRDRKTNREIAADLFLSEKTVETHLRHIFGKLGVSSRASVARAIEAARRERA